MVKTDAPRGAAPGPGEERPSSVADELKDLIVNAKDRGGRSRRWARFWQVTDIVLGLAAAVLGSYRRRGRAGHRGQPGAGGHPGAHRRRGHDPAPIVLLRPVLEQQGTTAGQLPGRPSRLVVSCFWAAFQELKFAIAGAQPTP
jgi:hypothetical protein